MSRLHRWVGGWMGLWGTCAHDAFSWMAQSTSAHLSSGRQPPEMRAWTLEMNEPMRAARDKDMSEKTKTCEAGVIKLTARLPGTSKGQASGVSALLTVMGSSALPTAPNTSVATKTSTRSPVVDEPAPPNPPFR